MILYISSKYNAKAWGGKDENFWLQTLDVWQECIIFANKIGQTYCIPTSQAEESAHSFLPAGQALSVPTDIPYAKVRNVCITAASF